MSCSEFSRPSHCLSQSPAVSYEEEFHCRKCSIVCDFFKCCSDCTTWYSFSSYKKFLTLRVAKIFVIKWPKQNQLCYFWCFANMIWGPPIIRNAYCFLIELTLRVYRLSIRHKLHFFCIFLLLTGEMFFNGLMLNFIGMFFSQPLFNRQSAVTSANELCIHLSPCQHSIRALFVANICHILPGIRD